MKVKNNLKYTYILHYIINQNSRYTAEQQRAPVLDTNKKALNNYNNMSIQRLI
jgi:hypothetical protein